MSTGAGQSRAALVEALANVAVGFIVAVGAQQVVLPLFGFETSLPQHGAIAAAFTLTSLLRAFLLRRLTELNESEEQVVDDHFIDGYILNPLRQPNPNAYPMSTFGRRRGDHSTSGIVAMGLRQTVFAGGLKATIRQISKSAPLTERGLPASHLIVLTFLAN
ncbi:hypothetical protein [Aminobacter aminovorans]|uniref:DUF7220 family protein n=1 Tax=Aminobacter aminovorans TaxID=83263 RepID=UPI0028645730|nr:hypothetical protein [Aminobacter aminovorans]MDR7225229.1 hypothetical protein [Aminobacter aminovorans]